MSHGNKRVHTPNTSSPGTVGGNSAAPADNRWPFNTQDTVTRYYPLDRTREDIQNNKGALFSPDNTAGSPRQLAMDIWTIHDSVNPGVIVDKRLQSSDTVKNVLDHLAKGNISLHHNQNDQLCTSSRAVRSILFSLFQTNTCARMEISYETFQHIVSYIKPFPELFELISAFGRWHDGIRSEGWTGSYYSVKGLGIRCQYELELGYIIRHVEPRRCNYQGDRRGLLHYAVRKTCVYHKFSSTKSENHSILIQASKNLQSQLQNYLQPTASGFVDYPKHWTNFQLLTIQSISSNWVAYTNFLAKEIDQIHIKFKVVRVQELDQPTEPGIMEPPSVELTFYDMQDLQTLTDMALRAVHTLDLNCDTLQLIMKVCRRARKLECPTASHANITRYERLEEVLDSRLREQMVFKKNLESLCRRAERISQMIGNAIALQDSTSMKKLTKLSYEETRAMKTLTIIALIYLPASFTARTDRSKISIHATSNLWLYAAITISLMVSTILGYWLHNRRQRKSQQGL